MTTYPEDILQHPSLLRLTGHRAYAYYMAQAADRPSDLLQSLYGLEIPICGSYTLSGSAMPLVVGMRQANLREPGRYILKYSQDYRGVLFLFDAGYINEFVSQLSTFPPYSPQVGTTAHSFDLPSGALPVLEGIIANITMVQKYSPCMVRNSLTQLMLLLVSDSKQGHFAACMKEFSQQQQGLAYIMEANFTQALTLERMAALAGRSITSLKNDFRRHFDTSPFRWLINRRLEHAHQLLGTTSLSVSEAAYRAGFENLSHFSRSYRKKFGYSPSAKSSDGDLSAK